MKVKYLTSLITNLVTEAALSTKVTEIENKIPDTADLISTPEFNRLTKMSFDVKMRGAVKNLANKSQIDNAIDIADKNRGKIFKKSGI